MGVEPLVREPPPTYEEATFIPQIIPPEEEEDIIIPASPRHQRKKSCWDQSCQNLSMCGGGCSAVCFGISLFFLACCGITIYMLFVPPNWNQEFTTLPIRFSQPMYYDTTLPAEEQQMFQVDLRDIGDDVHEVMSKYFTICVQS